MTAATEETGAMVSLYLLFSRLLDEELSPELREILLQPDVLAILSKADPKVETYLNGDWQPSDYEDAAAAFCDTFVLPDKSLQPRAVAWLTEGDPVTADGIHSVVDTFITEKVVELPKEIASLPFDHASILFFVAATLRQMNHSQFDEFEQATIGSWIKLFGQELQKRENHLYRALGKLITIQF